MNEIDRHALATTAGVLGAVVGAFYMHLDNPYWAALSALIIANVDRTALFTKGLLRIAGTGAGIVGGYYVALALEGIPIAQFAALTLAAGFGTYLRQRTVFAYAWFYGALSFMLLIACSMTTPEQLYTFAHYRCYEIVLGVGAATLANWALGPRAGELPTGLARAPIVLPVEDAIRESIAAAVGTGIIALAWTLFELPSFTQVIISSLVIIDRDLATTSERARQRILGCVIGGAAALAVIGINADNFVWWFASLATGTFLSARVHLSKVSYAYVGTQSAIALLVTLVETGPPTGIEAPFNRLVGIMIGVAIMELTIWMLAPRQQREAAA
ncbi:FUSC family protein [Ancylobacter terrae]|uniref:FUSC family protein n=1 Tax=Ancylobacter sp. sgz301288 TaxID=3342077 RepID=UPI003858C515